MSGTTKKQDRDKTRFAYELGLFQWKRIPLCLCNATATFQRLMSQALTRVTKKNGSLVMCYMDDVVIATPPWRITSSDWMKCSKCEILTDSIKDLRRMVGKHGIRPMM